MICLYSFDVHKCHLGCERILNDEHCFIILVIVIRIMLLILLVYQNCVWRDQKLEPITTIYKWGHGLRHCLFFPLVKSNKLKSSSLHAALFFGIHHGRAVSVHCHLQLRTQCDPPRASCRPSARRAPAFQGCPGGPGAEPPRSRAHSICLSRRILFDSVF